jgi:general stress protein YciG
MTVYCAEKIYADFLFDCYIANLRLTDEEWLYYGRENHHIEVPQRENGLLTPLNSQHLTSYQHWIAGVLQSEILGKRCFAFIPSGVLPSIFEKMRKKWQKAPEENRSRAGVLGGNTTYGRGNGFFSWDKEKRIQVNSEAGKIGGKSGLNADPGYLSQRGKRGGAKTANTRAVCLLTGFESNISGLTRYQRSRGICTDLQLILPG